MHTVDLLQRTRNGQALCDDEIRFLVNGAAEGSIPAEQLAAWLMAVFFRGLQPAELHMLTDAMRRSGECFDARQHGQPDRRRTVDKHSTGGVGDKTSLLVAPIAAAAGLLDPMISGRALGHTGGTLDKLESIPGFRTDLSLAEMQTVLEQAGFCMAGQSAQLVPADRTLYALRDRTATVESPYLICASIMSKKLAAGLDALVLDVKTGSGAFLRDPAQARLLAQLLVETGERAGTRTAALLTDMSQPLGSTAGNWLEVEECCTLLRGERPAGSEDLRSLSLVLAGWMLCLGGAAPDAQRGRAEAEALLSSGAAWERFERMIQAQGGDIGALRAASGFHTPGAEAVLRAPRAGYLTAMDTAAVGWAIQRLGAGRTQPNEPVDAHAGVRFHRKLGDQIEAGEPLMTMYATRASQLEQAHQSLSAALQIADGPAPVPPLVGEVLTRDTLGS